MNDSIIASNTSVSTDEFTWWETAFYLSNGAFGTVFNSLVLWIAVMYIDTDDKPRQIIVINMTFADLLMCILYMMTRPYMNTLTTFLCHPYYVIVWTTQLVSCMNLVWLNVDKLIYIQYPLHYYSIVSRYRLLVISTLTWGILGLISIIIVLQITVFGNCIAVSIPPLFYMPICVFYIVMILASFIISAVIYFIAHTSTKMESRQRTKLFHRLFFLFSSTLWTFFTCLPYRVLYLNLLLCNKDFCKTRREVIDVFFRILVVGTVINPLITIWTQRIYRSRLIRIFSKFRKSVSLDDTTLTSTNTRRPSSKGTICLETAPLTSEL